MGGRRVARGRNDAGSAAENSAVSERAGAGRRDGGAGAGSLIRIRRRAAGLTQQELAELAQVSLGKVLGPVAAWRNGTRVGLGEPRQRMVLALLALNPDVAVSRESLIDAVWPRDPPGSAAQLVQAYVSRLRRMLDPGRPARDPGGLL